jgi:hypothetical protein
MALHLKGIIAHCMHTNISKLNIEWSKNSDKIPTYAKTKSRSKGIQEDGEINQFSEILKIIEDYDNHKQAKLEGPLKHFAMPPIVPLENIDILSYIQLYEKAKILGYNDDHNCTRANLIDFLQAKVQFKSNELIIT